MKILIIFLLAASVYVNCEHLVLGDSSNKPLFHHEVARYHGIPLTKREKNFFFSSPDQKIINSIMVYDNLHSRATAMVTAGGVGFTYVNLHLKSERGEGLDYDIGIYG